MRKSYSGRREREREKRSGGFEKKGFFNIISVFKFFNKDVAVTDNFRLTGRLSPADSGHRMAIGEVR